MQDHSIMKPANGEHCRPHLFVIAALVLGVVGHLLVSIWASLPCLLRTAAAIAVMVVGAAAAAVSGTRGAVVGLAVGVVIRGRRVVGRGFVRGFAEFALLVVDATHCASIVSLVIPHAVTRSQRAGKCPRVPFDDFLPIPSLSTTSSAHWMWRRCTGSARRRRVPDGRFSGDSPDSVVTMEPFEAEASAVRRADETGVLAMVGGVERWVINGCAQEGMIAACGRGETTGARRRMEFREWWADQRCDRDAPAIGGRWRGHALYMYGFVVP